MEELTLLHHVAYSGNIEALNAIAELPYFKDIIDESNNEVNLIRNIPTVVRLDPAFVGSNQETYDSSKTPS